MKTHITIFFIFLTNAMFGQVMGNINYQERLQFSDSRMNIGLSQNADFTISAKGMANIEADTYVALFNVTQIAKTAEEVNTLIDDRIAKGLQNIKTKPGIEIYIDMISFVSVYAYEVEKKAFSKKTYNEIPSGFELKKNIHIKYSDPELLNEVIADLSRAEIYDLIRVDYFSNNIEATRKQLREKATTLLKEKLQSYEGLMQIDMDSVERQIADGYKVAVPAEMYKSYQAYQTFNTSSLNSKNLSSIKPADKPKTLYYQPILDKDFDFVINPIIFEPVIQVIYEIKLMAYVEKYKVKKNQSTQAVSSQPNQKATKEYILITPTGEVKKLNID